MAKAIRTSRDGNQPLADRLSEVIQEAIDEVERESAWVTCTIEFQAEAGKLRTVRKVTNQTWKDGTNGEKPLTQSSGRV